jgi:hypothetical protein
MSDPPPPRRRWSTPKVVVGYVGALLLIGVVLQWIDGATSDRTPAPVAPETDWQAQELRPRLERVDDETILIYTGLFHHTRFRLNSYETKEEVDAIYACLEQGIEEAFPTPAPPSDKDPRTRRQEMRDTMREIQDRCIHGSMRLPELPVLPEG